MTTKTTILSLALAASSLTALAGTPAPAPAPAPAVESSLWTGSVTLGYDSKYIFRGLHVTDDLATAALDLNYAVNDRVTLNMNVWYANGAGHLDDYDELNLYGRMSYKFSDSFTGAISFRYYDYPSVSGGEQYEPGLEGVWTPCENTTINMGIFWETETEALYAELGASYVFKISDTFSIIPGAVISYLDRNDYVSEQPEIWPPIMASGYDASGMNHAALYIKAPITLKSNVTLTPYIAYNMPLDTIEDAGGLNPDQDDQFYGGASLTVGF
jgi:hypothetical protein